MKKDICCLNLLGLSGQRSPFSRLIAFGYEDGPTSGIARCGGCGTACRFELLALDVDGEHDRTAWDVGTELRIFCLAPLPHTSFDQIATALSSAATPRWPVWVPDPASLNAAERIVNQSVPSIHAAGPPYFAIATADLLGAIFKAREISQTDLVKVHDWFGYLGIVKRQASAG